MAEYIYKDMANAQGWGMTFSATGRFPIIANRIFPTLSDLEAFISTTNGTAIAGVTLSVVNDGSNNGVYRIEFKDTNKKDEEGKIDCEDNLQAVRLIDVNNQGGITSGIVVEGYEVENGKYIAVKNGDVVTYVNENGETITYTPTESDILHTYIVLNLTNGDKVYINADELKSTTDTFANKGEVRIDEDGDKFIDIYNNSNNDEAAFSINVNNLMPKSTVTYTEKTETQPAKIEATEGFLTQQSITELKKYIDVYDCGTFELVL